MYPTVAYNCAIMIGRNQIGSLLLLLVRVIVTVAIGCSRRVDEWGRCQSILQRVWLLLLCMDSNFPPERRGTRISHIVRWEKIYLFIEHDICQDTFSSSNMSQSQMALIYRRLQRDSHIESWNHQARRKSLLILTIFLDLDAPQPGNQWQCFGQRHTQYPLGFWSTLEALLSIGFNWVCSEH